MSIARLVDKLMAQLLNDAMNTREHRPPLTSEERSEKLRLRSIYKKLKSEWKNRGEKLTDSKFGEIVADATGREQPYTQGFIWQITSDKSNTRVPDEFAHGMAKAFNFPVEDISPRFNEKIRKIYSAKHIVPIKKDLPSNVDVQHIEPKDHTRNIFDNIITIQQYTDVRGAMGSGAELLDLEGEVLDLRVSKRWAETKLPANTGSNNLKIITGWGDSMKGLYNSGDPLIVDIGVTSVGFDAVYFFRVGDEGYVKRLQKVGSGGLRVLSENPAYPEWYISKDDEFEVFGRVLKVWEGKDL